MKVTCNELRAISGPPNVDVTLVDVQSVKFETPQELEAVVKQASAAAVLEIIADSIGLDKILKHFGVTTENDEE